METTLYAIYRCEPCGRHNPKDDNYGWGKLLKGLNKTTHDTLSLSLLDILKINGLDNTFWAMRALIGYDKQLLEFMTELLLEYHHIANTKFLSNWVNSLLLHWNNKIDKEELISRNIHMLDKSTNGLEAMLFIVAKKPLKTCIAQLAYILRAQNQVINTVNVEYNRQYYLLQKYLKLYP